MRLARDRILRERNLVRTGKQKPSQAKQKHVVLDRFVHTPNISHTGKKKTALMKYLETKYKVKIEEVLVSGSLYNVSKILGNEVDVTTLSRWIKRFRLRYTEDNLPECKGCVNVETICQGGVCPILMKLELYDLVLVKRDKILHGG